MKKIRKIKSCMIFADEGNKKAVNYATPLRQLFEDMGRIKVVESPYDAELIIVLGGDGTMLKAVQNYHRCKKPFLGINFGNKGFLMNDVRDVIGRIIERKIEIYSFPLLRISGKGIRANALNDFYVKQIDGKNCKLNIKVNGELLAEKISGDGIIISTALGSTAYALAAGGSAIDPNLPAMILVPNNVHTPIQTKPMVFLFHKTEIEVEILSKETKGWYDGIELPDFEKVKIKAAGAQVNLAFWEGENFTKRLFDKIMKIPE